MSLEELREYCLSKEFCTEDTPFGPNTLVFRIAGKIFGLTSLDSDECRINLKCEPDYAIELREKYDFIIPGYHMNKTHWNTVIAKKAHLNLMKSLVDHSYEIIKASLSKKQKELLLS
jgi:predicted DNA-binding protein (MmcQ/YjbR family)